MRVGNRTRVGNQMRVGIAVVAGLLALGAQAPRAARASRSASTDPGAGTVRVSEAHSGSGTTSARGGSARSGSRSGTGGGGDDTVVLPAPVPSLSPRHRAVVGVDLVVTAVVPAVREPAVETPEGADVVRLRVASVAVDFGDGTVAAVPVGAPAPVSVELHHSYADADPHTIRTSATWSARYVPAQGPAEDLPDVTVTAPPLVVPTVEVRSVLVE